MNTESKLNDNEINTKLGNLFIGFKKDSIIPARKENERKMISTEQQKTMTGQVSVHESHNDKPDTLSLPNDISEITTDMLLDYLQHYGWMSGIKMDTNEDGTVQGNEWEHIMPFLSQILFGGGLATIPNLKKEDYRKKAFDDYFSAVEDAKASSSAAASSSSNDLSAAREKVLTYLEDIKKIGVDYQLSINETTDGLSDNIVILLNLQEQEKSDLYLNRLRLNVMTMGKCESWINQYKTNVILQKLVFTKDDNDGYINPRFNVTNNRLESFFNMMNKTKGQLKTAIDRNHENIWKVPILNSKEGAKEIRSFRDTSLPKDKDWYNYNKHSPRLETYWNNSENPDGWKELAKHNTKKILERVNYELNKNIHTRVLFNCIKFACILKKKEKEKNPALSGHFGQAVPKTTQSSVSGSTPDPKRRGTKRKAPGSVHQQGNLSAKKLKKKEKVMYNYIKVCLKKLYPNINEIYKKFNEMPELHIAHTDKELLYEVLSEILCGDASNRFDSAEIIKMICTQWHTWLNKMMNERPNREEISIQHILKQKDDCEKYITMFDIQYCYDGELARWCNQQLFEAYGNSNFVPYKINEPINFHKGYHLMNATKAQMIYFLMKKMTYEIWGLKAYKMGNQRAIEMGFGDRNIPAVDYTFNEQQNEFRNKIRENDKMPKPQYEATQEWRWDDRAWWESYQEFVQVGVEATINDYFPPKDKDGDDDEYPPGFPLMQYVAATPKQQRQDDLRSSGAAASSAISLAAATAAAATTASSIPEMCNCGGNIELGGGIGGKGFGACRTCGKTYMGGKRSKKKKRKTLKKRRRKKRTKKKTRKKKRRTLKKKRKRRRKTRC